MEAHILCAQALNLDKVTLVSGAVGHSTSVLDVFRILNELYQVGGSFGACEIELIATLPLLHLVLGED